MLLHVRINRMCYHQMGLTFGQAIKATPDEIQVLTSMAAALRVQENIKATIKLEGHLAA